MVQLVRNCAHSSSPLAQTATQQLRQVLESRLPKFAFDVPIKMPDPQPALNMKVFEGDEPFEIIQAFLAQNDLDAGELLPKMVRLD
jgi:hypothetical protein